MVNNLGEVFNRIILDLRGKLVKIMFDDIRKKLMTRNEGKRTIPNYQPLLGGRSPQSSKKNGKKKQEMV